MRSNKIITVIAMTLFLNSCAANEIQTAPSEIEKNSVPEETSIPRATEVKISLDLACEYVRTGFDFDGSEDQKIDAKVSFEVAADLFREVILDFQGAQEFMNGAVAASREVYRWANDASLLSGARNQTYISQRDGNSIISLYNYCVASKIS
jgi:hypothetical protein